MVIEIKVFAWERLLNYELITVEDQDLTFTAKLQKAIVLGCRKVEAPIPLWLDRNTNEFARFRQTIFFDDQFMSPVNFSRLQIKLLETE